MKITMFGIRKYGSGDFLPNSVVSLGVKDTKISGESFTNVIVVVSFVVC